MEKKSVMNFRLVRNDFSFEAAKTLRSLFDQADFSDVTLVSEDQKQISAHKVILASGSPFFKNIFLLNPHPKPLIYLKVKFSDLQGIVRFVYTGQCHVGEEELDAFLELAKTLEVVGLASDDGAIPVKTDSITKKGTPWKDDEETLDDSQLDDDDPDNLCDVKYEYAAKSGRSGPLCKDCELVFASNNQLEEHMIKEHRHSCNACNKKFSSPKTLNSHKRIHNIKKEGQDPDLHFPETEEEMLFFGSGERGRQAYDKHFFAFR